MVAWNLLHHNTSASEPIPSHMVLLRIQPVLYGGAEQVYSARVSSRPVMYRGMNLNINHVPTLGRQWISCGCCNPTSNPPRWVRYLSSQIIQAVGAEQHLFRVVPVQPEVISQTPPEIHVGSV